MKIKIIFLLFLMSFFIVNLLMYLDYETVSLLEIYRNSDSLVEVLFGTLFLFVIITIIYFIGVKVMQFIQR